MQSVRQNNEWLRPADLDSTKEGGAYWSSKGRSKEEQHAISWAEDAIRLLDLQVSLRQPARGRSLSHPSRLGIVPSSAPRESKRHPVSSNRRPNRKMQDKEGVFLLTCIILAVYSSVEETWPSSLHRFAMQTLALLCLFPSLSLSLTHAWAGLALSTPLLKTGVVHTLRMTSDRQLECALCFCAGFVFM